MQKTIQMGDGMNNEKLIAALNEIARPRDRSIHPKADHYIKHLQDLAREALASLEAQGGSVQNVTFTMRLSHVDGYWMVTESNVPGMFLAGDDLRKIARTIPYCINKLRELNKLDIPECPLPPADSNIETRTMAAIQALHNLKDHLVDLHRECTNKLNRIPIKDKRGKLLLVVRRNAIQDCIDHLMRLYFEYWRPAPPTSDARDKGA